MSTLELALLHTEEPTNMATDYNSQNWERPTNMAADDYNIRQPSQTLSRSQSPSYWLHTPGLTYTVTPTVYKDSHSNTTVLHHSIRSLRCSLPVDTKSLSCHSVFWLRFLFWLVGLCLCPLPWLLWSHIAWLLTVSWLWSCLMLWICAYCCLLDLFTSTWRQQNFKSCDRQWSPMIYAQLAHLSNTLIPTRATMVEPSQSAPSLIARSDKYSGDPTSCKDAKTRQPEFHRVPFDCRTLTTGSGWNKAA